jgi:hypothetical protein
VEQLAAMELAAGALENHGAAEGTTSGNYRLACLADASRD